MKKRVVAKSRASISQVKIKAVAVGLGLAVLLAAPAMAQGRCTGFSPPSGSAAAVAQACRGDAENNSTLRVYQKGLAFYHLAAASNAMNDPVSAAQAAASSYSQLPDSDAFLALTPPDRDANNKRLNRKAKRQWPVDRINFLIDRAGQYAAAYQAVATGIENGTIAATSAPCVSAADCRAKALEKLNGVKRIVQDYARDDKGRPTARYDNYFLALANLHRAQNTLSDSRQALEAYRSIMEHNGDARRSLYDYAMELAAKSASEPGPGNADAAMDFYRIAGNAFPNAAAPAIGMADMNARLGNIAEETQKGSGAAQYLNAAEAYTAALSKSPTEAERVDALIGRGTARFALGQDDAGVADYQAASQLASSSDVYLKLAEVFWARAQNASVGRGNALKQADENYAKAIANLPASLSGQQLSDIYLHYALVRSELSNGSDPQVKMLLDRSIGYAPDAWQPRLERANILVAMGGQQNIMTARQDLTSIVGKSTNPNDVIARGYSTLAATYAAASPPNWAEALKYSEDAALRDGSNVDYRAQVCIARLKLGRAGVTGEKAPKNCTLGSTVNDLMLQGMYTMRRAEMTSSARAAGAIRADVRSSANRALDQTGNDDVTNFGWPSASAAPTARTKAILVYLREAALSCNGGFALDLPSDLGITPGDYSAAENFLAFYGANKC